MERRNFLKKGIGLGILSGIFSSSFDLFGAEMDDVRQIVIRTAWSNLDVGEIANLQGAQNIIQRGLPRAKIYLWPAKKNDSFIDEIKVNYTSLNILDGTIDASLEPDNDELKKTLEECDLVIWMGGVIQNEVRENTFADTIDELVQVLSYCQKTEIQFGLYGTSFNELSEENLQRVRPVLNQASFIFTMESASLDYLKDLKLDCKKIDSGTNLNFSFNFNVDRLAKEHLTSLELIDTNFIALTTKTGLTSISEETRNAYCTKINSVIKEIVNEHQITVLVIPSGKSEIEPSRNHIYEPLKSDLGNQIKFIDEFLSPSIFQPIIQKARFYISMDLNALVLGYSMGTPGVYFSLPEFGNQSELLEDLGIKNWKINLMEVEEEELVKGLTKVHKKYVDALVNIDQIKKPIAKGQDVFIQYAGKLLYSGKGEKGDKKEKGKKKKKK